MELEKFHALSLDKMLFRVNRSCETGSNFRYASSRVDHP